MRRHGVEVFESTVALIEALRARGRKIACVSSSNNCRPVLERAKLTGLFDAIVDGNDLERKRLAGKPAPDTYLRAAALLAAKPEEAAVIEDAVAGVAAGRAGDFGLVIGIDRGAGQAALQRSRRRRRGRRHGRVRDSLRSGPPADRRLDVPRANALTRRLRLSRRPLGVERHGLLLEFLPQAKTAFALANAYPGLLVRGRSPGARARHLAQTASTRPADRLLRAGRRFFEGRPGHAQLPGRQDIRAECRRRAVPCRPPRAAGQVSVWRS